jgi:hypothetical protein
VPFGQRFASQQKSPPCEAPHSKAQASSKVSKCRSQGTFFNADGSFSVANPSANCFDWSLRVRRTLIVYLVSTSP